MGRKKGIGGNPNPYFTQLLPLTPEQLSSIFCSGQDLSGTTVSFVASPQSGQIFLMDCVVFGRYDSHRWSNFYCHNGMGPLAVDGAVDPLGDKLEVRYNKKLGKNGSLCEGAVRLVYKLRGKQGIQNKPAVEHHAVQYLEKLPDQLLEVISQEQEQMKDKMKEMEVALKKERETEAADKEDLTLSSSFGRKRKPNSWYSDLYDIEDSPTKVPRVQETQADTENEEEECMEEDDMFAEDSMQKMGRRGGKQSKVKGSGMRHESRVWMAGYGLEKTKPKSSLLFRMYEGEDEESQGGEGESEHAHAPAWSEGDLSFCESAAKRSATEYLQTSQEPNRLLYYSVDIPSPVLVADKMLSSDEIADIMDAVLEGRTYVCTSPAVLPKLGELFVLKAELGVEDGESKEECGIFHNKKELTYTCYHRLLSSHICSDTTTTTPDVKVVYRTIMHPHFCLVHYLSPGLPRNEQWKVQETGDKDEQADTSLPVNQNTNAPVKASSENQNKVGPNVTEEMLGIKKSKEESELNIEERQRYKDVEAQKEEVGSAECGDLKHNSNEKKEGSEIKGDEGDSEKIQVFKEGEKRGKQPGRPRYRGLDDLEENTEEEEEEGRRKDFEEDEPRPFKVYNREKLYHADAEELFSRAKREGLTVYKTEVRKPQYGDIYLLDKHFVPYSDSLAWVREYYYKSPLVLLERFTLRDPATTYHYPLSPTVKSVFTLNESDDGDSLLCIVHYQRSPGKRNTEERKVRGKARKREVGEEQPGVYTESNSNLNLSLVESMLTNPDQKRIVSAPILSPQPFQVYLVQLPPDKDSKVLDNYRWTDKGFKRWPPGVPIDETRLLCHHSPMKVTRGAMCPVLMRHEFRHTSASPHLRVVHYMPTREFREYIVIANAAAQMEATTESSREGWENMEVETETPIHVSCSRLKPAIAWDLLSRDATISTRQVLTNVTPSPTSAATAMEIITPQPGGVYLSSKYEAPDLLKWEELGKLQVQPRMYQLVEVCERVRKEEDLPSYLVRLTYTSPKVPHRILVHYLGDTRPYLVQECQVVIDGYTGEPCYRAKGRKVKHKASLPLRYSLKEKKLYHISTALLREAGCCPLTLEDLDLDVEVESKILQQQQVDNQLISPDKPGLYLYGYRMVNKRVIRLLENIDRSRKTHLPIKNPEAGEAYLVTKPSSSKVAVDPYKWTQKGWQSIPRKGPIILWRWGLMRHRKQTWAPPLIRIDYVHVTINTDLMFVHYLPTKDNQNMLEIKSALVPMRTQTHTLLSMGDVNFGQHSQLLTNSPLPPSHIWELLNAGGGLTLPLSQPQPGGVYVINLDEKETLDWLRWRNLGSLRLSSADYCLMETASIIDWDPPGMLARLTYHSPLVKSRTVLHYLGDSRPYLDKAKAEEVKHQRKLETIRRKASTNEGIEMECLEIEDTQLSLPDISCSRDAATEAVGTILTGLGPDSMDTDTLNHTFAELGGEVEGLCESDMGQVAWREEDDHLRDANLPAIQVPFGSVSTASLVKQLFPQGLPKIVMQKVVEVETGENDDKRQQLETLLDLPDMKSELKAEEKTPWDPHRAVPRTMIDWTEDGDEHDDLVEDGVVGDQPRARLQITTAEPRTIVYLKQHDSLTEKQIDHMLCNADVNRISFLPLIDPQAGEVYVVAVPYRKGETRRLDCYNWYVTGHKKGKYRRTYSYIREKDGNTSHRLMRYSYDYAWEAHPGLRVVHYIQGNPRHQVQCSGKKPNFEEECENQGDGPMYRAYTAPMTHRDVLFILNDPPHYHLCELPLQDPRAGDVYIVKAPSVPLARREMLYDNLTWGEGQVKHVGGKRPVVRKIKYPSVDPEDGTKSDAFVRVTWERLVDVTATQQDLPSPTPKKQPYLIIHYLGDETLAGEMVRKGKDGALHLRQIRHYMETGSYLPSVHITEKNGIRKSAKKFMMEGKTMYYIGKTGKEKRLVLYTNEEKNKVFEECHIMSKTGEHCGRTKTLRRLTEKYYWTSMVEDIVALIVRCKTCEFSKMNRSNQRFVRVTEPWEVVSIDIIGQFVSSERGHVFLAIIIDMLTKYTIAVPLRDTTAVDVTKAIQTAVFQQGPPRKFVSDQHEEFIKELNIALELDSGLVGNVLAVNKTQINRPDEANIKTSLLQHCLESGSVWDDVLQRKIYEINTSFVTSSGHTPFYLMFHRQPRPMDVIFSLQVSSNAKPNFVVRDIERYMEERECKASDILTQALSGQTTHESSDPAESESGECVDGVSASVLLDAVAGAGQGSVHVVSDMEVDGGGHTGVQVVSNMEVVGVDQDHAHYTHVTHLPNPQVIDEDGGSVYEMGDGEGQVVVVANGLPGLDDGGGGGGEVMVVQPSGGGEQGVIMLAENQVIMETVDGRQFTYVPQT